MKNLIVFWQNVPSIHQAPLLREVALQFPGEVLVVTERDVSTERLALGWKPPKFWPANLIVEPNESLRGEIINYEPESTIHIFSGFHAYPKTYQSMKQIAKLETCPYQMFMKVVSGEFVTMGRQLLGVIFFFIPRSIWASKPVGSGHLVAERFGYTLSNISMNFFGEGYINFVFWGIVLFVILLASINCKLDKAFWRNSQGNIALSTFYFLFLGLEVFILRGDFELFCLYMWNDAQSCFCAQHGIFSAKISAFCGQNSLV